MLLLSFYALNILEFIWGTLKFPFSCLCVQEEQEAVVKVTQRKLWALKNYSQEKLKAGTDCLEREQSPCLEIFKAWEDMTLTLKLAHLCDETSCLATAINFYSLFSQILAFLIFQVSSMTISSQRLLITAGICRQRWCGLKKDLNGRLWRSWVVILSEDIEKNSVLA